jgi:RNase P subunit RPR2
MPSRRPQKYWCKICNKNFPSGRVLGGHMSCHRHAGKQLKSTPDLVVNLPVPLLGSSDEKSSLSSLESQSLHCSKVLSSCQSPRGDMGINSEKKVVTKSEEPEPAGLMESWANGNGDHGHSVMLFSPVKRKRSKRVMPVLKSEMDAAVALLMLAEHSDKTSAYEDCCGGDKDHNISTPMVSKEINLNAFDQLVQSDESTNSARLQSDKNPAYEGFDEYCEKEKENSLNLAADAPKKEVMLNVFDYEMDVDAEFMKPGDGISVEELKSSELSAETNIKRYQCKVCRKLLSSRYALGCHIRLHCEKESSLNLVTDAPKKEVLLDVFDHGMDVDAEFIKPGTDISVEELKSSDLSAAMNIKKHQCKVCRKLLRSGHALGGHMSLHFKKKNKLNSGVDVPKEVLLDAFVHEVDADIEFMKPATDLELKSSDISAAVNVKTHQCKVCGKVFGSGHALGGHMRLHYVRKSNPQQEVAD